MFSRREDKRMSPGSSPFQDDNKYAKTPMGTHNKQKPHFRLRKRHAVLVLCLVAATYMFLKSPSNTVSWDSTSTSSSGGHEVPPRGNIRPQGQDAVDVGGGSAAAARKKFVLPARPAPQLVYPVRPPSNDNNNNNNSPKAAPIVINSNAEEEAKRQQQGKEKKKKRKKKLGSTLFEFSGKDPLHPVKGSTTSRNNQKTQLHDWRDNFKGEKNRIDNSGESSYNSNDENDGEESSRVKYGSEIDLSFSDSLGSTGGYRGAPSDLDKKVSVISGGQGQGQVQGQGQDERRYPANSPLWETRKNKVKDAFLHSWNAYKRDAWGKDEYHPISKYGSNMIRKGQGFTIVDSLDTILLMGLEKEFEEAKNWVETELDFDQDGEVNLFETTIRVLGGLLSAYDQSGHDAVFLDKAVDLADRLMGAFDTASGIPYASVHLKERRGVPSHDRGISSTSEVATLQMEFKYLSYLTGDDKYWKVAENVVLKIRELESLDGLVPIYINPYTGSFQGGEIRLGSRGDSYYEYLIKQYLQTGKTEPVYKDMYDHAIGGVKKHLVGRTIPNNLLFVGEISKYDPADLSPKMDHLVCFLGGTMALASTDGHSLDKSSPNYVRQRSQFSKVEEEDFKMGEELTEACYEMYHQTETGLAPEIVYWVQKEEQIRGKNALQHAPGSDFIINDRDGHNWLRPETVESLFYMWRLTGDEKYRQWGWSIFESIEKYSKVSSGGYSSIHDIREAKSIAFSDKMETFFLAETLKYFYLLFGSDDVWPLDKYVFNTEAHPLPIFTPPKAFLKRTGEIKTTTAAAAGVDQSNVNKSSGEDLGVENDWYKMFVSKEDGAPEGGDDEQEDSGVSANDNNAAAVEDQPESDDEGELDGQKDEVDQGLEDPAVEDDEGEGEEAEYVPDVEVDYEETPELVEEEGEEGDEGGEDDGEGEGENEEGEGEDQSDEGEEGEDEDGGQGSEEGEEDVDLQ